MDSSVQNRRTDDVQLRVLRRAYRGGLAGQCRLSRRQKDRLGLKNSASKELPGSRAICAAPLPSGLEALMQGRFQEKRRKGRGRLVPAPDCPTIQTCGDEPAPPLSWIGPALCGVLAFVFPECPFIWVET